MAQVVSVNIGAPQFITNNRSQKFFSAINKKPVSGKIFLGAWGLNGDSVADKKLHGGHDKAVCVYSSDHFPYWKNTLSLDVKEGSFGENLTLKNLNETQVCIGDIWVIGGARLECSQPRQPCRKLNQFNEMDQLQKEVHKTGYSGFYLRVLEEGWIEKNDQVEIIKKDPNRFTIQEVNGFLYSKQETSASRINDLISMDSASDSLKSSLRKKLHSMGFSEPSE